MRNTIGLLACVITCVYAANPPGSIVFESGKEGYACYRIPALLALPNGDLLAFAEGRKFSCSDHDWNDIVMKRYSSGEWGNVSVVYGESTPNEHITIGNPAPVLGSDGLKVHLPMCRDNKEVLYISSSDGGASWPSKAADITSQVVPSSWSWVATGPPGSILTKNGSIIVAADHIDGGKSGSHTFRSDDGGTTWRLSGLLNVGNECQVAEVATADGSEALVIDMRPADKSVHHRLIGTSTDFGASWTVRGAPDMPDPRCEGSLVAGAARSGSATPLYASNAATTGSRSNMTVYSSHDSGASWQVVRNVFEGPSAYSSLQVLPGGAGTAEDRLGLLWEAWEEGEPSYHAIHYVEV